MNIKFLFIALFLTFSFTSCEKDEEEEVTPVVNTNNNQNGGNNGNTNGAQEATNNSVKAGNDSALVTTAFVTYLPDNNAGGDYYYSIQLKENAIDPITPYGALTFMRKIPSTSTTLKYTTKTGATMNDDEFNISWLEANNVTWRSVLGTSQAKDITVIVNGDKISFSYVDVVLSDNFLQSNVTATKNCSSKFTLSLSELQAIPKDGSATLMLKS